MNEIINRLPKMETGEELLNKLTVLPDYGEDIRTENEAIRLMGLEDIYKIYLPSTMTKEIYSKLYLATIRSLQKKETKLSVMQQKENFKRIQGMESNGIIGGSDSFTILGDSGIGKSSAISKAIDLITGNKVIETERPYSVIIPAFSIQCPFDCSIKGLLYEVLRKVDEILDTDYYKSALRANATTDMLIGSVSQIALNHIGVLIVDEIQNVVNHRNGNSLVAMLTQLINSSGISICMVGTPESGVFFERIDYLARRALGLKYTASSYDDYFKSFCTTVFSYQYTKNKTEINDSYIEWLYEHSGGILSNVVTLIHDAQELSILSGREEISFEALRAAYKERMGALHTFIHPSIIIKAKTPKKPQKSRKLPRKISDIKENLSILELSKIAKKEDLDIVELLSEKIIIEEVAI